jgi:uncharacterized protein (TIGR02266 family)
MERARYKRKSERVVIDSGKIYDLSEGGIYIRTIEPKRLGSLIAMELKLLDQEKPLLVKGRVLRIIYEMGARQKFPPGMGVQFEELSEQDKQKIRQYLSHKKPAGL